ncbi:MAG: hypothetical protein IPP40_15740 [bacterium]|nr:hypothetical protein [bacterium]
MYGNYVYAAFDSVAIFDISDLENPVQVGSGITESPRGLVVSDEILYVLGQFQVYACSLDDPANPTYLGGYNFGGTRDYSQIIADRTTIYLYGEGMIQAVDLSNPQTPIELSPIGFFGNFRDFDVENGVLAIGGSSDGVTLIQYADPLNPFVIGYYAGENYPGQVTLRGSNLFVSIIRILRFSTSPQPCPFATTLARRFRRKLVCPPIPIRSIHPRPLPLI